MEKKITVIGGSGFVGTNFCHLLSLNKLDFEIIDLKMSKQFSEKCKIGDIRNLQSMRDTITGDVVVNLAAVHRDDVRDKSEYQRTNVDGVQNLVAICSEKGIYKIIFTSTVAVYGFAKIGTDIDGKINPFNEYGRTKFDAEEKLREWNSNEGNSLIIVRLTVIFGVGNRGNVFNLFHQIESGKFIMIGKGENKKSMAYIGNVVHFLMACVETDHKYGLYNYVDTPDLTMNELVSHVRYKLKGKNNVGLRLPYWFGIMIGHFMDAIYKITGKNLSISSIRVRKFVASTKFNTEKSKLDGFDPPFQLLDGITNTLESEFIAPEPKKEIFYTE